MKKNIILFFSLCISFMLQAQTSTPPSSGDGSASNPYQISTLNNLYWLSQDTNRWNKHYIQIADIDASSTSSWNNDQGWLPMGYATGPTDYSGFSGTYKGKGHVISNLYINRPSSYCTGFFGFTFYATIDSLGFTNVNITGGDESVGALVGMAYYTNITNCYSSGNVTGISNVGGLIGNAFNYSNVQKCYSSCNVSCSDDKVGGLMGKNESNVRDCYATGNVTCTTLQEGHGQVGGLIGKNMAEVKTSYATGAVSGCSQVGGLVGDNNGEDGTNPIIDSCYATGEVSSVGSIEWGNIGGLVGTNHLATIINSYSTGNVNCHNNCSQVGGLCGTNEISTINNSYSTGNVVGGGSLGGLVGHNTTNGNINNSYSRGNVTGQSNNVGGLVGRNTTLIDYCYSTGIAFSYGCYGGLSGSNEEAGTITNCFWDQTTSGLSSGCGYDVATTFNVLGKTTNEMKTQSTFTNSGFDFVGETANGTEDIWKIDNNINNGYPSIFWQNNSVGINDIRANASFSIFPNPASNQVFINLKNYNKEKFKLNIYNQLGMIVKTVMINQTSNRINISELNNGIYFLKIDTPKGVSCKKLIIQK